MPRPRSWSRPALALALLASVALAPLAQAQTRPVVGRTSVVPSTPPAPGTAVAGLSDIEDAMAGKLDTLLQQEFINQVLAGISPTYMGFPYYPQPGLLRVAPGHIQAFGPTGGWGDQTNIGTFIGNPTGGGTNAGGFGTTPGGFGNNGNQGNYWDPNYRNAYGGQDAGAVYIGMAARTPVVTNAPVQSFTTTTIATPLGNRLVYQTHLATPLTPAQIADMGNTATRPPSMRMQTSGGYFLYTIPKGMVDPSGNPVPPVSADGYTVTGDGPWVCVTCSPEVLPVPGLLPPTGQTITIDTVYVEDGTYGILTTTDLDQVNGAAIDERVVVNDKASIPVLDLLDVNQSVMANGQPLAIKGYMAGVQGGNYNGSGLGQAYMLALGGWQAAFVAQNGQTPTSGSTYGLLGTQNGPTWLMYSVQPGGYLIGADPGNSCATLASMKINPAASCARSVLLSAAGDLTLARSIHAASVESTGSLTSDGVMLAQAGLQSIGTTSFRSPTGQTAYVDGPTGNFVTAGIVNPGKQYMGTPPAGGVGLSGCSSAYIGATVFIADGRKAGEAAGAGSGTLAVCEPLGVSTLTAPVWARLSDNVGVQN